MFGMFSILSCNAGTFCYDVLLKDFLQRSPSHHSPHLPSTADQTHSLSLALAVIYGSTACKQQALQVSPFLDLKIGTEITAVVGMSARSVHRFTFT